MRSRNIKPGFFDNPLLADGGPYCQLLFAGLWCIADRDGRLKDEPRRIQAKIFPYYNFNSEVTVDSLLNYLHRTGFIVRYEVTDIGQTEGQIGRFIEIVNFLKHQSPHSTEKKSYILGSEHGVIIGEIDLTVNPPLDNGEYRSDSLIHRFTDSQKRTHPIVPPLDGTNGPKPKRKRVPKLGDELPVHPDLFHSFWEAYPRKAKKQDAIRAWNSIHHEKDIELLIIQKVKENLDHNPSWHDDDGKYIPYPASWLRGRRWMDELGIKLASKYFGD